MEFACVKEGVFKKYRRPFEGTTYIGTIAVESIALLRPFRWTYYIQVTVGCSQY